jgi:hypothetical protein
MGVARGQPAVAACALCSGAGGGRRQLAGPKGLMGRLAAERKLKKIFSDYKLNF